MTVFVVTIDVEADMPEWKPTQKLELRNITAIPRLQLLFNRYNVRPTYLITHEVAIDTYSRNLFSKLVQKDCCEVGSHFHPWTTPPLEEEQRTQPTFPHELEAGTHREKLESLHEAIKENIGVTPVSYRAGRFGIDATGLRILHDLGYLVDTSYTPYVKWNNSAHLNGNSRTPFFLNEGLLEVPITIGLNFNVGRLLTHLYLKSHHSIKGALKYLNFKDVWLRPSYSTSKEMVTLCKEGIRKKWPILNMMFHSSELAKNCSPFNTTDSEVDAYFNRIENVLSFLEKEGITSMTLKEYRSQF